MTKLPLDVLLLGLVGCDDRHIPSFTTAFRQQTLIHLSIEMKGNKLQQKKLATQFGKFLDLQALSANK
jgi:hypothetical protein